jgi:hypothetical protein
MRGRWFVLIAALFFMSACGGGTSRAPLAPSNAITATPGTPQAPASLGASSVSWQCFTRLSGGGGFGASGCPAIASPFRRAASAPLTAPSAPTGLSATVTGSIVTLNWSAPIGGDAPTSYLVQAGSSAGLTDIASFDTGGVATSLTVLSVPSGTYFVRLGAVNSAGISGPSNEVQAIVAGSVLCVTLSAPIGVTASVTGDTVFLTWSPPSGCAPSSYVIQVGSSPGLSNLASFSTGSTATTFTATGVAIGTYYLRILSAGNGILSTPSNEVTFAVGAAPPPPPPPPPATVVASFQLFDPGTQGAPTTECRIRSMSTPPQESTCTLNSTSFTLGSNAIVSYAWTVEYQYDSLRTIQKTGSLPTLSFTDICGLPTSTDSGNGQSLSVTLTVTDNLGATATATAGAGSQPALQIRLFTCGS